MILNSRFRRQADAETLRFPLPGYGRLALVDTGFRTGAGMHACGSGDLRGLAKFGPESLVLPLETALSFADQKLRGSLELPSLRFAMVVLTSLESLLTEQYRDLLWLAFGVPVFEQLRGWDGRVIARECEVHDGLHVDGDFPDTRREELMVVPEHCDCGLTTPRVREFSRFTVRKAAAA